MNRLWAYIGRYRGRFALGSACLLATATMVMAIPSLTQRAIDSIGAAAGAAGVGTPLSTEEALSRVSGYAGIIILLAAAQAIVRTFSRALIFNSARDVEYDLRNDLYRKLTTLDQNFYNRQRIGDLMSRLVNDIGAVRLMLGPGILTFVNTPVYCLYAFALMLRMDARLTIAAMVPFTLILVVIQRYSQAMMEATVRTQQRLGEISSFAQESIAGVQVAKSYVAEDRREEAFRKLNEHYKEQALEVAKLRGKIFPAIRIVSSLGVLLVLWYGGTLVVRGELTVGQLVAFIAYLNILAWPIMALGWMITLWQRGKAAILRLGEILDAVPDIQSPETPDTSGPVRGEIEFRGVSFHYDTEDGREAALRNIDLTIPAGSTLGILGRTGSGKTTLARLIGRMHDVSDGELLVDGVDVRRWDLAALRGDMGYVPQDPLLFSATVEQNLRFARPDLQDDELQQLIRRAGLESDIAELPNGLQTEVGERGVSLSGGQKQRVTLARALAANSRVLVLDDALASVDAATEHAILEEMREVTRASTTVLIAHKVSTVRDADRIVVLDEGQIVETGTHDELVNANGLYADLYQRQRIAEELAAL